MPDYVLELLSSFDPDVVLIDLKMPVLDGLGLVTQGKPLAPNASFLVMTAFGSVDTAVNAIKAGARELPHQAARSRRRLGAGGACRGEGAVVA